MVRAVGAADRVCVGASSHITGHGCTCPTHAAVDAMPPFMKPLAAAIKGRGKESIPFKDPFQHDPRAYTGTL